MRIAFFSETFMPKVDGIVTRLRNTISQLRRAGDQVLIFAPEGGIEDFEGARVIGMPAGPFPLYPELRLALPRRSMRRVLTEFKPDIIHAVDPVLLGIAGIYYASTLRIPLIVSYHTQLPKYLHYYRLGAIEGQVWRLLRARHNRAAVNLCTSSSMVEELSSHGIDRVALWQRGIDTEMFRPANASPEMRTYLTEGHPDSPLLLYVGRLSAEKNIEQIRSFLSAIPNARLALVGGGPYKATLEKLFHGTRTFFAGYLQGAQLASAFASSDLFVLPSRTETLGLVLLEAMAAGCPAVAARAGGIPDLIEHEVSGFLFDEVHEGVAAAQLLLRDTERRESVRRHARLESEKWSWAAATDQLRNFYTHAASANTPVIDNTTTPEKPLSRLAKSVTMGVIRTVLP
jgi:glycosyltransferase involved in cell wall biosynthesis